MTDFYKNVVDEDFALCEAVQKNLTRGVFDRGPLHPFHEEGAIAFQGMVVKVLREHVDLEEKQGREIWAAKPQGQGSFAKKQLLGGVNGTDGEGDAKALCEKILGCDKTRLEGLEW